MSWNGAMIAVVAAAGCGGRAPAARNDGGDARAEGGGDVTETRGDTSADASRETTTGDPKHPGTFPVPDGGDCGAYSSMVSGVCLCRPYWPLVCDGDCVDVQTNDLHCGACGHACPASSTCNDGQCGPAATLLQPAPAGACGSVDIDVVASTLFWTHEASGKVWRAPALGRAPILIAEGEDRPRAIQARGTRAFWLAGTSPTGDFAGTEIRSASDGTTAATIAAPAAGVTGFIASPDGQAIYYGTVGSIQKVAATPGALPAIVATDGQNGGPRALALDGARLMFHVYEGGSAAVEVVASVDGPEAHCRVREEGGLWVGDGCATIGQLLQGPTQVFSVAAGGIGYWAAGPAIVESALSPPGPDRVPLATFERQSELTALCAGGDGLVFATSDGDIGRRGIAAPPEALSVRVARGQNAPRSVASDGVRAFWSTSDREILSAPL